MSRLRSWAGPAVIVLILIVTGLLTVIWPAVTSALSSGFSGLSSTSAEPAGEAEPETVTIDVDGYLLGEELAKIESLAEYDGEAYSSFEIFGLLTAIIIGALVAFTIPIAALVVLGDRAAANMKEKDEKYQAAVANIEKEEKQFVKQKKEEQPPTPKPLGTMPRWSAVSTGLLTIILAYFFGIVVAAGFGFENYNPLGIAFALIALVAVLILVRPQRIETYEEETERRPVPWATLWIILSGAIMLGLGIGFMMVVISGGDPFNFLTSEWWYENVITPLTT